MTPGWPVQSQVGLLWRNLRTESFPRGARRPAVSGAGNGQWPRRHTQGVGFGGLTSDWRLDQRGDGAPGCGLTVGITSQRGGRPPLPQQTRPHAQ